jgi:hypothetical protein
MVPPVVKAARDRNWRRCGGCGGAILWRCAEYEESHDIITTLTTPAFTEHIKQLACDRGQRTECRKVTEVEVSKLEIASEYLDAAIGFFLARTNYFCATISRRRQRNCLARIFPKINASLRWPGKLRRR